MKKTLLLTAAEIIETPDDRPFDMRFWGEERKDCTDPVCGTAVCAMGKLACHPYFRKKGLRLNKQTPLVNTVPAVYAIELVDANGEAECSNWDVPETLFGISGDQASYLFAIDYYKKRDEPLSAAAERVTPKMVANRIREFVASGGKIK